LKPTACRRVAGILLAACLTVGGFACATTPAFAGETPKKARKSTESGGALFAASFGGGTIRLFWTPPAGGWPPGGWRIEDGKGETLLERLFPGGDEEALSRLSPDEVGQIRKLLDTGSAEKGKERDAERIFRSILKVNAALSWDYARAIGLGAELRDVKPGKRAYRAVGLDAEGKPTKLVLSGRAVDAAVESRRPAGASGLRAEVLGEGVALYWQPGEADAESIPVLGYFVERVDGKGAAEKIGGRPVLTGVQWKPDSPVLIDSGAELEESYSWRVTPVDLVGRTGETASVAARFDDLSALEPPGGVQAESVEGGVAVTWKPVDNPFTAGYRLERALSPEGPFLPVLEKPFPRNADRFEDTGLRGGTTYFYRLRSVGPRGDLGEPSILVTAGARTKGKVPPPERLAAEVSPARIRLSWAPVDSMAIAGYFVERRSDDAPRWARLTALPVPEARFDDRFPPEAYGRFRYRVVSIAFDSKESAPSGEVEALLPDTNPPPPPTITASSGEGGRVRIGFAPGLPEEKSAQFLVIRGVSHEDPGVVLGDPLSGREREFADDFVIAGKSYWYSVAAVDPQGRRGEPSDTVVVTVGTPPIPVPKKPKAARVADPFPSVELTFDPPPERLVATVQGWRTGSMSWVTLSRSIRETRFIDPNPSAGDGRYRIVYEAENGVQGEPSETAEVGR
jgi:hypothetical protein